MAGVIWKRSEDSWEKTVTCHNILKFSRDGLLRGLNQVDIEVAKDDGVLMFN